MPRPTLLLVHGAWHGSWFWEPLISELGEFDVRTVDLPSCTGGPDELGGLEDDAETVRAAIAAIDGPVVVVAHSYGGAPTTEAAVAPSVQHIVYIAAFALDEGESLLGAVGGVAPSWWVIDGPLVTAGTAHEPAASLFFADVDPELAEEFVAKLKPQSRLAFEEPLTAVAWREKPTTYIITEQDAVFPVPAQEALSARSGSTVYRLDTSHSPFLSQPEAVADIIEAAASTR